MKDLGEINSRRLIYIHARTEDWRGNLPTENWLVMPIGDDKDRKGIEAIVESCLHNGVKYVCALGEECEFIHDVFDDSIVNKRIKEGKSVESEEDFEYEPMTTWHNDFDEGIWFAIHSAYDDYVDIDKVVFLDMTENGEIGRVELAITKE